MCRSAFTLLTASMAAPKDPLGLRSNDTVMTGNCPWCEMVSGSVGFSKCAMALRGTALAMVELVVPAEVAPLFVALVLLALNAPAGAVRMLVEGVYSAVPVNALEPAEAEPDEEKDAAAAVPATPDEALDWMYRRLKAEGSSWKRGALSRMTWY